MQQDGQPDRHRARGGASRWCTLPRMAKRPVAGYAGKALRVLLCLALLRVIAALPVGAAEDDCRLVIGSAPTAERIAMAELAEGLVVGQLVCGHAERLPIGIWTLSVDPAADHLGVRDNPLFSTDHLGPLTQLFQADIGQKARIAVYERSATAHLSLGRPSAERRAFRRYAAVCDAAHAGDPMLCSLGAARIKVRVTALDEDFDGALDTNFNEISLYDGKARLNVVSFRSDYAPDPASAVADWIGVIDALTDYLDAAPPVAR